MIRLSQEICLPSETGILTVAELCSSTSKLSLHSSYNLSNTARLTSDGTLSSGIGTNLYDGIPLQAGECVPNISACQLPFTSTLYLFLPYAIVRSEIIASKLSLPLGYIFK